jgi:hypothetical protein
MARSLNFEGPAAAYMSEKEQQIEEGIAAFGELVSSIARVVVVVVGTAVAFGVGSS